MFDAAKQRLVHEDGVAVLRQNGGHVALDRLHGLVGVRARQIEEDSADPFQRRAASLQRLDGVGESGRCRVAHDRVDLGALPRQRLVESRAIMLVGDRLEGRNAAWIGPDIEERIAPGRGCDG